MTIFIVGLAIVIFGSAIFVVLLDSYPDAVKRAHEERSSKPPISEEEEETFSTPLVIWALIQYLVLWPLCIGIFIWKVL
jgi:hypothetical protein